jgi:peptide/nickel transport system permease protein
MSEPAAVSSIAGDRPREQLRRLVRRFSRSRNILVGGVILTLVIALALLAPVITVYEPTQQLRRERLQPPDNIHLFGTDNLGRDIFTRVLYGGQVSLQVGIFSVALGAVLGTLLGLLAGYLGGWWDVLVMRLIDVMLAFPGILLALGIIAVLGRDLRNVMIAVGIASIPVYTRVVRSSTLSLKEYDFVMAARALGAPAWRIILYHILPNVLAPIIVITTNGVAGAIISGAALSFLGLGQQPPNPEWGLMLNEGREYIRVAPWITTYPGLAIVVTVLSINLLGDGLRDIFDPRLRL